MFVTVYLDIVIPIRITYSVIQLKLVVSSCHQFRKFNWLDSFVSKFRVFQNPKSQVFKCWTITVLALQLLQKSFVVVATVLLFSPEEFLLWKNFRLIQLSLGWQSLADGESHRFGTKIRLSWKVVCRYL